MTFGQKNVGSFCRYARLLLLVACTACVSPGYAQVSPLNGIDSTYAKKTDVPSLSPVQSVTGKTGSVQLPTVCGNSTIPGGNTVTNTASETAFASTCIIPANTAVAGYATHLHVGGVYSAGLTQSAKGKVKITQAGTPAPATDTTIINTGSVGGLANATNQEWFGDIWITFQTAATAIDVQGALTFQTGGNATVTVPIANTSTFLVDARQWPQIP